MRIIYKYSWPEYAYLSKSLNTLPLTKVFYLVLNSNNSLNSFQDIKLFIEEKFKNPATKINLSINPAADVIKYDQHETLQKPDNILNLPDQNFQKISFSSFKPYILIPNPQNPPIESQANYKYLIVCFVNYMADDAYDLLEFQVLPRDFIISLDTYDRNPNFKIFEIENIYVIKPINEQLFNNL